MKRAPLVTASMTAIFVAVCLVEAWTYPIKPPDGWRPAWWQFDFLVELGYWISTPSIQVLRFTSPILGDSQVLQLASLGLPLFLTILIAFFLVFYTVKAVLSFSAAHLKDRGSAERVNL